MAQGNLLIFDGETGDLRRYDDLNGTPDDTTQNGLGDRGGGAPNIDDFDGDGFPEIGTALGKFYTVIDLQPTSTALPGVARLRWARATLRPRSRQPRARPRRSVRRGRRLRRRRRLQRHRIGECVCLHNGWKRATEDDSSRATSSSVFDFNGDGAAEVVYNDECYFRIYDGARAAASAQRSPR